jgi:hypothetical protein
MPTDPCRGLRSRRLTSVGPKAGSTVAITEVYDARVLCRQVNPPHQDLVTAWSARAR